MENLPENLQEHYISKFWKKVDVKDIDSCWNWIRSVNRSGYGKHSYKSKTVPSHRMAYAIHNNLDYSDLTSDDFICHRCDNPSCNNPYHLFLGNVQINVADMIDKGRQHRRRIITDAEIFKGAQMRENGHTYAEISKALDFSRTHCRRLFKDVKVKPKETVVKRKYIKCNSEIAYKIRELRNGQNLSINETSAILNVSRSVVIDVSLGKSWVNAGGPSRDREAYHKNGTNRKLSTKQVEEIKSLHKEGLKQSEICKRFDIAPATVSNIINGKTRLSKYKDS